MHNWICTCEEYCIKSVELKSTQRKKIPYLVNIISSKVKFSVIDVSTFYGFVYTMLFSLI